MLKRLSFILCLYFGFTVAILNAAILKSWEMNLENILTEEGSKHYTFTDKNIVSDKYSPVISGRYLVIGTTHGQVKLIDIETKEVTHLIQIPLEIEGAVAYNDGMVVFTGKHRVNQKFYYCAISIKKQKIMGVIRHTPVSLPFGEWTVLEKNKNFIIFSPKKGRRVYSQNTAYSLARSVYSPDKNRFVFMTHNSEIVDLLLPKLGSGLMFYQGTDKNDILTFKPIIKVDKDVRPDTISADTLFYHRTNGIIGFMDLGTNDILWERTYFRKDMSIKGPHIHKDSLIYLVSYPESRRKNKDTNQGKLISIQKDNGQSNWVSKDLPFTNFGVVQFLSMVLSSDNDGNLLFLDAKTGDTIKSYFVGEPFAKPVVQGNRLFILTNTKIIQFHDNNPLFKLQLLWVNFKETYL